MVRLCQINLNTKQTIINQSRQEWKNSFQERVKLPSISVLKTKDQSLQRRLKTLPRNHMKRKNKHPRNLISLQIMKGSTRKRKLLNTINICWRMLKMTSELAQVCSTRKRQVHKKMVIKPTKINKSRLNSRRNELWLKRWDHIKTYR